MMNAIEFERRVRQNAFPDRNYYPDWQVKPLTKFEDFVPLMWKTFVPGSGAPEYLMVEAVQSSYNMGRDPKAAEDLLERGFGLLDEGNLAELTELTENILKLLDSSPAVEGHRYSSFYRPLDWYYIQIDFPRCCYDQRQIVDARERIYSGILGQIIGASMGTRFEGFYPSNLKMVFGDELGRYIGKPSTVNDDITYEIVFLEALKKSGRRITSADIAKKWIEYIPFGWSAELIALLNLRKGIEPPYTGTYMNPFQEWIGAQMRGMIHGFVAYGNPREAARLAYLDGIVSHSGNGVYGEIHSAVLTSLSFLENDTRELLKKSLAYVPEGSELKYVLSETIQECRRNNFYGDCVTFLMERFKEYCWVHLYPNAAAVAIALWYCENDFNNAMEIIANLGFDVDCNAGEVGTILGVMNGVRGIDNYWSEPVGDRLETYIPEFQYLSIRDFAVQIADVAESLL